eukprot:364208-Chlamydomonas_euryale.AAC.14
MSTTCTAAGRKLHGVCKRGGTMWRLCLTHPVHTATLQSESVKSVAERPPSSPPTLHLELEKEAQQH